MSVIFTNTLLVFVFTILQLSGLPKNLLILTDFVV